LINIRSYLRVIVDAKQLRIEFHPEGDGVTTKTPDDFVTVFLKMGCSYTTLRRRRRYRIKYKPDSFIHTLPLENLERLTKKGYPPFIILMKTARS
jgi:hypothetical protein